MYSLLALVPLLAVYFLPAILRWPTKGAFAAPTVPSVLTGWIESVPACVPVGDLFGAGIGYSAKSVHAPGAVLMCAAACAFLIQRMHFENFGSVMDTYSRTMMQAPFALGFALPVVHACITPGEEFMVSGSGNAFPERTDRVAALVGPSRNGNADSSATCLLFGLAA